MERARNIDRSGRSGVAERGTRNHFSTKKSHAPYVCTQCVRLLMAALAKFIDRRSIVADARCSVRRRSACESVPTQRSAREDLCRSNRRPALLECARTLDWLCASFLWAYACIASITDVHCTSAVETFVFPIPAGCGRSIVDTPFETASSRRTSSVVSRWHPGSTSPQRRATSFARKPGWNGRAESGKARTRLLSCDRMLRV